MSIYATQSEIIAEIISAQIPASADEAFAWGFLAGCLGETRERMRVAFKQTFDGQVPEFLEGESAEASEYSRGFKSGVATHEDHANLGDRE